MKKKFVVVLMWAVTLSFTACQSNEKTDVSVRPTTSTPIVIESNITAMPTLSPTLTSTPIPSPTLTNTPTPSPTPTNTPTPSPTPTNTPTPPVEELNEEQKNSIAMLNYLAVLSQEINSSKNSRMFLEEAYASLINNTNPEKVNELTESHLSSMLDIIEKYRMNSVKRERLQYIYEQNKAKALKAAMPNPIALHSVIDSDNLIKFIASAIYMRIDADSSYEVYNIESEQEFLQDGWELDYEEAENLHDSRKRAFMFMVDIVREYNLPGELALSEKAVENFVTWKNETNVFQKIQFFEAEEDIYQAFGSYWLELVDCYYEKGEYKKCLETMDKYEELQTEIFRKDYYFALALPKVIVAAREVCNTKEYISRANRYIELLVDNTENNDWSLKYFAAEMYLDLYAKTNNKVYINKAYELAINNVNNLVAEQRDRNAVYLAEVQEIEIPDDTEKEEKKKMKAYNKFLHKQREVELPPVYEPLALNCDLLFALAKERNITRTEKNRIEGILRNNDEVLFLSKAMEEQYSFNSNTSSYDAEFNKDTLLLPASCVSEKSVIKVTVTNDGQTTVYDDWVVKKVKRPSDEFETFIVTFTSKKAGNQKWSEDASVKVEVFVDDSYVGNTVVLNFKVSKFNGLGVLPDVVEFEQVK